MVKQSSYLVRFSFEGKILEMIIRGYTARQVRSYFYKMYPYVTVLRVTKC